MPVPLPMPLLVAVLLVFSMMMSDQTVAYSQATYGVPVEAPTRRGEEEPRATPVEQMGGVEVPRGSAGGAAMHVTPLMMISERYDSNIYQAPGRQVYDFVTRISPGARVQYENDLMVTSFLGNVFADVYARNPGLNYVGTNGLLQADLSNMVGRMVRGVTFRIADSFMYTPQMPGFASPESGNELPAEFIRGIQTFRQNALTNALSIQSMYAVTPRLSANVSYSYSIMRFLNDSNASQSGAALFNTTSQSITAGPQYHLSSDNVVGVSGQFQHFVMEPSAQAGTVSSPATINTIYGASVNWQSSPSPTVQFNVAPGLSFPKGSDIIWTVRAQVTWALPSTTLLASYVRGVYPLYFVTSGVSISDMAIVSISHRLNHEWRVTANGSYALNEQVIQGSVNASSFSSTSYGGSFALMYYFSPTMTLQGAVSHQEFQYQSGGTAFQIPRDVVTLTFRNEWR